MIVPVHAGSVHMRMQSHGNLAIAELLEQVIFGIVQGLGRVCLWFDVAMMIQLQWTMRAMRNAHRP